jgi:hypothetical protein
MRVRVRFRYREDTGEVEAFVVEDIGGTDRAHDHDAEHDRITAEVARVVEQGALIEEVQGGLRRETARQPEHRRRDTARREDRTLDD